MNGMELKELLDTVSEKTRKETIKEVIEFAEWFFSCAKEGFVRRLKERCGVEVED